MPPLIALIRSRRCGHHGIWPKRLLAWKSMGWPSSGGDMFSMFTLNYVAQDVWVQTRVEEPLATYGRQHALGGHDGFAKVAWNKKSIARKPLFCLGSWSTQWPTWATWTRSSGSWTTRRRLLPMCNILPSKKILLHKSSTLILFKELSSSIFQSLSVSQQVRHRCHLFRSPFCSIY